ncbi:MAG TPA: undecaprenyl-phosphate galactose phosphotransferase WbaP [Pirellulales bacterium]|jgi:Undecaprenyl-phosphate galactose phosphotransferase WbaP|nr:undecaprenyl-phosphate galactose phosphotransferase WbaP [Pirellulales bacterium]
MRYMFATVLTSAPLLIADFASLALALWAAHSLQADVMSIASPVDLALGGAAAAAMFAIYLAFGLYPGVGLSAVAEVRQTWLATTSMIAVLVAAALGFDAEQGSLTSNEELTLLIAWPVLLAAVPIGRRLMRRLVARQPWWGYGVIVFGGGREGASIYHRLMLHREQGLRPLGVIDDLSEHWRDSFVEPAWYLGPFESTESIAKRRGAFWGVVAMSTRPAEDIRRCVDRCARTIHHMVVLPDSTRLPHGRAWESAHDCAGVSGLRLDDWFLAPVPRIVKRSIDLAITLLVGAAVLPLLLLIAVAIKCTSRGPVLYSQMRVGRGGKPFKIWKFRSMVVDADERLAQCLRRDPRLREEWNTKQKLTYDPRITLVGRLLRKTSLDELPQLWNVLVGNMSLVGPRPILECQMGEYAEYLPFYTRVRPGITGIWQISGRNKTTFAERIRLDAEYARVWSPWLDLYILVRTLSVVLRCEGAC